MRVYIPSRGRADERVARGPAAQMPRVGQVPFYVVYPEEVNDYARALAKYGVVAGIIAPEARGIAARRHAIGQYAAAAGEDRFCMIDDDVGFLVRKHPEAWNLRSAEPEDVGQMLSWVERTLDDHAHVSVSSREGNNRAGPGDADNLVELNTRTQRVLAYRTEEFLSVQHGRVQFMEDFDVSLQLLRAGHSCAVTYWWAQGQRMTGEDGGCSVDRTHAAHEASAHRLAELHPGLVRLRQKSNKTDRDGFGTRTEVTISWKKAYLEGQHLRALAEGLR